MNTVPELCQAIKGAFPEISAKADLEYKRYWGTTLPDDAYAWLQSLANALNGEMQKSVPYKFHEALFAFISSALSGCSAEVRKCIDVSFVENLFWQVPSSRAEPYWQVLPQPLKELYVGFHRRTPL